MGSAKALGSEYAGSGQGTAGRPGWPRAHAGTEVTKARLTDRSCSGWPWGRRGMKQGPGRTGTRGLTSFDFFGTSRVSVWIYDLTRCPAVRQAVLGPYQPFSSPGKRQQMREKGDSCVPGGAQGHVGKKTGGSESLCDSAIQEIGALFWPSWGKSQIPENWLFVNYVHKSVCMLTAVRGCIDTL